MAEPRPGTTDAQRRRALLDAVFGDVLPDQTSDDAGGHDDDGGTPDAWLRREVPPHHGS